MSHLFGFLLFYLDNKHDTLIVFNVQNIHLFLWLYFILYVNLCASHFPFRYRFTKLASVTRTLYSISYQCNESKQLIAYWCRNDLMKSNETDDLFALNRMREMTLCLQTNMWMLLCEFVLAPTIISLMFINWKKCQLTYLVEKNTIPKMNRHSMIICGSFEKTMSQLQFSNHTLDRNECVLFKFHSVNWSFEFGWKSIRCMPKNC